MSWKEGGSHRRVNWKEVGAKGSKGRYNKNPQSLYDLSPRTVTKLLKRMKVPCSRCGWNEETVDIHHIYGRKIENPNNHENLTLLCPNCHRLADRKHIAEFVTLKEQIGDKWKEFYFG